MLEDKDFEFVEEAPVTNEEVPAEEEITADDFTLTEVDSTIHEQKFQTKPTTFTKDAFRRFKKNKSSVAATYILGTLVLLSIVVPLVDRNDIENSHPEEIFLSPKLFNAGTGFWDGTERYSNIAVDISEMPNATTEEEKPNGDRTDSVSVNVSVNDSVNVSDSVNVAEAKPAEPAPARKRFVKPELEEIREFCFEKNINIDVDRFFNYYESKGWKVGVSPMKDWKAAVRNWAKNDSLYSRPGSTRISSDTSAQVLQNYTAPETETDVESNLAEIQGVNNAELEEDKIVF